jgi:hypothetical protein
MRKFRSIRSFRLNSSPFYQQRFLDEIEALPDSLEQKDLKEVIDSMSLKYSKSECLIVLRNIDKK